MLDTFPDGGTYNSEKLGVDIRFKTYSDAKLASLLLDYDFPVYLFKQVFQLVKDPDFRSQDVTLKDLWEIFELVSERRREVALERDFLSRPRHDDEPTTLATAASTVPPLVLDLIVNRMLEDDIRLGVETEEPTWKYTFTFIGADFCNMSLVHRSWTSTAQNALRRRVVVPYQQIDSFLLSPLCGPWVREIILYWTVDNGRIGITESDILLLDALLRRTPNVRLLSFMTSLVWPKECDRPPLHVDRCLDILSARLPGLEKLWLKHFDPYVRDSSCTSTCDGLSSLCTHLPKFRSLRFLSIQSWSSSWPLESPLDWNEHPPCRLKSIVLDLDDNPRGSGGVQGVREKELIWLLKPRDNYRLESLSIVDRRFEENSDVSTALMSMEECLSEIVDLKLCFTITFLSAWARWAGRLPEFKNLNNLDLFMLPAHQLDSFSFSTLPSSLKRLAIYCDLGDLLGFLQSPAAASNFIAEAEPALPQLPLLQHILIKGSRRHFERRFLTPTLIAKTLESSITQGLIGSFKTHNIELSLIFEDEYHKWE